MRATKVSEDGETIKKMKSQPPLSRSVENAVKELSEIKKFIDFHPTQINDYMENKLNICFNMIHDIKERIGTVLTHQLLDRGFEVVINAEVILPTELLELALTCHHFFNRFHFKYPTYTSFQYLKPQILTGVFGLPVWPEVRSIKFRKDFSGPVNSNNLPPYIESLDFSWSSFNSRLDYLPATVTKITLGISFNLVITKLPNSLTQLNFGDKFNHPISCLPQSLTHLEFGTNFNSSFEPLPCKLTHLTFGSDFNQPLTSLPNSLQLLSFQSRSNFNHPLTLPLSLTHLDFALCCAFNQKVDIPPTLTKLNFFVEEYNYPLKLNHCPCLAELGIRVSNRGLDFDLILPNNTITNLCCSFEDYDEDHLLPSLKSLKMSGGELNLFPSLPNLTRLFFDSIELNCSFKGLIPSLTSLTIDTDYHLPIDHQLPPSLTYLYILDFNQSVDHLPRNLQKLELYYKFSQPIDNLPTSLTSLTLGNSFDYPVDNLPPFLKKLKLGDSFNRPINNLPHTLQSISLGNNFNFPVTNLPRSLKKLYLGHKFNQPLNVLPLSLTSIALGKAVEQEICHLPNLISLFCSGKITFKNPALPTSLPKLVLNMDKLPDIYIPPKVNLSLVGKKVVNLNTKSMKVIQHQPLEFYHGVFSV